MSGYIPSAVRRCSAVLLAAVLGLAATPPKAAGQEPPGEVLSRVYSAEVVDGTRRLLRRSEALGLPSGVLADRALEGAAKGVPGTALIEGVERALAGLERASESLGPAATPASVEAGALALEQGLPAGELARIADAVPGAGTPAALLVVGELHRLGVPVARALEAVTRARARGAGAPAFLALGTRLRGEARTSRRAVLRARGSRGVGPPAAPMPGPAVWGLPAPPVPPGTGAPPGRPGGDGEAAGGGAAPGPGG